MTNSFCRVAGLEGFIGSGNDLGGAVEERRFMRRVPGVLGVRALAQVAPLGLKADAWWRSERGPEGPLFHGAASILTSVRPRWESENRWLKTTTSG